MDLGTYEIARDGVSIELNNTCTAILDNQYLIEKKDVKLQLDIRCDKSIDVKEEILYIAITNLIRNAFQFTSQGLVRITLEESRFSIKDTGTGIDKDQIQAVVKPHVKAEKSHGFGLGLSIVSRLCDRFGWELVIDSGVEKGTDVTIYWNDNVK